MKNIMYLAGIALVLSMGPAYAQTTSGSDDGATVGDDGTTQTETDDGGEKQGFFSTIMPSGLLDYFSDEEKQSYQDRLDAAETPQERNAIRQELQRENQQRHLDKVQETRRDHQAQPNGGKGLFESMKEDFNSIMSGRASDPGFNRGSRDISPSERDAGLTPGNAHSENGRGFGHGRGHSNAGGNSGGNGGGNGHGRN